MHAQRQLINPGVALVILSYAVAMPSTALAQTSIRDSAGVRIAETKLGTRLSTTFAVVEPATLDVGGAASDPRAELPRLVNGAVRLSNGAVVAAGSNPIHIPVFDRRGTIVATLGRQGQGPGEHPGTQAYVYRLPGDTIVVLAGERLSYFGPDYRLVRLRSNRRATPLAFVSQVMLGTLGIRDSISVVRVEFGGPADSIGSRTTIATFFNPTQAVARTVGTTARGARMIVADSPPFSPDIYFVADQHRFLVGDSRKYEIREFTHDGVLQRIIRLDADLRVSGSDIERFRDAALGRLTGDPRRAMEQRLRTTQFPGTFPAFQRLLLDSDGRLWVEAFGRPGVTRVHWTVFDRDGRALGTVLLPEGFRLFEAGRDYVLGRWRDQDGFARVRLHGLRAPDA